MSQKPHYADGEKVLCFHGPLLYEAKCLKSQIKDKTIKYFIHYSGWNKNWDEWVPECRVLKYNEINLGMQKQLASTHIPKSKKSKSSKSSSKKVVEKEKEVLAPPVIPEKLLKQVKIEKRAPASETPRFTKAAAESLSKAPEPKRVKPPVERRFEEEPTSPVVVRFTIPPCLRSWLVDDTDLINHQKKLLRLPARVTVDHIIANYVKEKVSVKGLAPKKEVIIIRVVNRIRDCFNVLLGRNLLHKFERPQYAEILVEHSGLRMCEIYGAVHLLRMFTTLGNMLSCIPENGNELTELVSHVEDFIRYIGSNPNFFSLDDYVVASPEYHRRALA